MKEPATEIKPRLKVGTLLHATPERTYIGTLEAGVEIDSPVRLALSSMNGERTSEEIASALDLDPDDVWALAISLDEAHLLDTQKGTISIHERFHSRKESRASHIVDDSNDAAYKELQTRLASELTFTTWLPDVRDGGVAAISQRRSTQIGIYGDSRIATLLFGILMASGISQTFIRPREKRAINAEDIGASYIRSSDIGLPLDSRTRELARELSLFPLPAENRPARRSEPGKQGSDIDCAIVVGAAPADLMQEWMSAGIPHLIIESPDAAAISIGPFVIPGLTPCARCISLAREDQGELWSGIAWQRCARPTPEVPIAVAHHISGIAALEILRFVDSRSQNIAWESPLQGARLRFDFHAALSPERSLFSRHPACGCSWK